MPRGTVPVAGGRRGTEGQRDDRVAEGEQQQRVLREGVLGLVAPGSASPRGMRVANAGERDERGDHGRREDARVVGLVAPFRSQQRISRASTWSMLIANSTTAGTKPRPTGTEPEAAAVLP